MTDRPIIFSAPMVRALLDGRKTQTRRILKPQIEAPGQETLIPAAYEKGGLVRWQAGDRLWVRESCQAEELASGQDGVRYAADEAFGPIANSRAGADQWLDLRGYRQRESKRVRIGLLVPSIHMPRWASRLTLMVTEVRVERLQDISEADAAAEGIEPSGKFPDRFLTPAGDYAVPVVAFQRLWESINGPEAWDVNPWVAAISFTVHRGNIDALSMERAA